MDIKFTKIFKVDRENSISLEESFENEEHVNNYIIDLLNKLQKESDQRLYKFDDTSTTVNNKIVDLYSQDFENVDDVINDLVTKTCSFLSQRLLNEEIIAQNKYKHLGIEIQKGMLIFTYLKMTDNQYKLVISKADYDKFIEETSGKIKEGLPLKKKIFKSFVVNVTEDDKDLLSITKLVIYDSNKKVSEYWWKEFLELVPLTSDEQNTIDAFDEIDNRFLKYVKRKSKADYLQLWNMTLGYFRSEGDFDFQYFKDEMIYNYIPISESLTKDYIKERMEKISTTKKFDNIFKKQANALNKRMKNIITLTNDLDLLIKKNVSELDSTLIARIENNEKYIMIKSVNGYEYALKRKISNE